jgi:PST family polysaccharide transporter
MRQRLAAWPGLAKVLSNTSWLFADRIVRLIVGLFVGVAIARYLGPSQYGVYSYALVFVSLFGAIATLGLDNIVIRDIVRDPADKNVTLGTTLTLKLIGGICAIVVSIGLVNLLRPDDFTTRWVVAIIAFGMLFQSLDTIDFWFQSQVLSKYVVYAKSGAFLLISITKIVLLQIHAPLVAFAGASLAEIVLGALGLVFVYYITGGRMRLWRVGLQRAKQMLNISWPLMVSGMAIMVYMKIDQIMLGDIVGNTAVGIYAAAVRISELWYFIPTVITASVFPSIVAAKKIGDKKYYDRLQKLFALMTGLAFLIAIPVTLFSNIIIRLLYGDSFSGASTILSIHIWSVVFVFMGVAQLPWDATEGLTKLALLRTFLGAIINVVMNVLLLRQYGGIAAAISTVVAYAIAACVANGLSAKTRPILILQLKSFFPIKYLWRATQIT